jgi:predicted dehydrogenase
MKPVRLAVIGVGHLGAIHARLLRQLSDVELVGVVDPSAETRGAVAHELQVPSFAEPGDLYGRIDGAIVAAPSRFHHAVANELLSRGIHVLVEKPMTLNVGDADDLVAEAASRRLVLQVGHVERFNPALIAAKAHLSAPKYIDAVRSGPFSCRSTDIGVVLDLMIHDIDAVLTLVDDQVARVEALGAAVLGPNEDWAQARLYFAGGCVANLFASRVAWQAQRSMHVVCRDAMATIDFAARQAKLMQVDHSLVNGDLDVAHLDGQAKTHLKEHLFDDYLPLINLPVAEANPLADEQREFVAAIRGERRVRVTGQDGRRALDVAERILTSVAGHRWDGANSGSVGPRFEPTPGILRGPHWHQAAVRRKAG